MMLNHHRAGSGEPLVLIHGLGSRWQMWEPVMDRLTAEHEVIALDLPGFGASVMPPAGTAAGLDSLADLVREFLSETGVSRPHVAGNSLGGLIALELARRGEVRSANALSPAGFGNHPELIVMKALLRSSVLSARAIAPRADALLAPAAARVLAFSLFVAHPARIAPRDAADSVRALARAPWFNETLAAFEPDWFARRGGRERIEVPVTIAWGSRDRLLPPWQAGRAQAAIPAARMVKLHGCGHVPTYDDPGQVARVLLDGAADAGA